MNITADTTLGSIASTGDIARRALDAAGIDYCCEGAATLREACIRHGLDFEATRERLATVPSAECEWAGRGTTALLEHILGTLYPRTKRLLDALVEVARRSDAAEPLRDAIDALAAQTNSQMSEEESLLFARVRALADARKGRGPFPESLRTIHEHGERLRVGHARTHSQLRAVRGLLRELGGTHDELRHRLDALAVALSEQMHLENNELMPRALDLEPDGHRPLA